MVKILRRENGMNKFIVTILGGKEDFKLEHATNHDCNGDRGLGECCGNLLSELCVTTGKKPRCTNPSEQNLSW